MSLNQIPDFMLSDEAGNVKDKIAVLSGAGGAFEKTNKSEFDAYKADNALQLDAKMDKFGGLIEGSLDMGSNGIILGPFRIIANVTQGSLDFELI